MPVRERRKRYLALKAEGAIPKDARELEEIVLKAILSLFGQDGASRAGLKVIEYDGGKGVGILRCFHDSMGLVRASLASVVENEGKPLALHVVDVSGTLRALRKRLPSRARP